MVVVVGYSVADSLSTSSPLLASSSSKKSALSVSTKPPLSNGRLSIRKSLSQLHKTTEAKAKDKSLEATAISAATRLLDYQKDKLKRERLNSFKVVDIINEEFKRNLRPSTVHQYFKQGNIRYGQLKRGPHGTVFDNVTYLILLRVYMTHFQLLQENYRKEPNLKDLITLTKLATPTKNRSTVERFFQNRLGSNAAVKFKTINQYDQESRRIAWTRFYNLNAWFDSFEKHCTKIGFDQCEANGSIGFIHPERIYNLDEMNLSLDGISGNRGGSPTTMLYDPNFSRAGNTQSNTSNQCTAIFGSNSLGQPFPTHFQLNTAANINLCIKIRLDALKQITNIYDDYGDGRK